MLLAGLADKVIFRLGFMRTVLILFAAATGIALSACSGDAEDPARLWSGQTNAIAPAAGASAVASSAPTSATRSAMH